MENINLTQRMTTSLSITEKTEEQKWLDRKCSEDEFKDHCKKITIAREVILENIDIDFS